MSKIAILTIAYNEEDIIYSCIKNWSGLVDKHLVLISSLSWNKQINESDNTKHIVDSLGAISIIGYWKTEDEQRNYGLAILRDYDYVLIVDPDELYTKEDQQKILNRIKNPIDIINRTNKILPAFKCSEMITYWKTPEYIFSPKDHHQPIIAVDPKQVRFFDKRQCSLIYEDTPLNYIEQIDCKIHHMSWVKTDKKVYEKIQSYSHNKDFDYDWWYDEIWLKWTPEFNSNIRPYGIEKSVAIKKDCPSEIIDLLKK